MSWPNEYRIDKLLSRSISRDEIYLEILKEEKEKQMQLEEANGLGSKIWNNRISDFWYDYYYKHRLVTFLESAKHFIVCP